MSQAQERSPRRWSVVIPTFGRADVLPRTLEAYLAQLDPAQDEILVVDDGSADTTPAILADFSARHPQLLFTARQDNAGPAAARNRALAMARGAWVLFAGDDVIPTPDLLDAHARVLSQHEQTASLGLIRWHPELPASPFMDWLERGGVQFAYDGLRDGQLLPAEMAYSSNLAISRALLPEAPVFDPAFRSACWEDVDLGLRLVARGVQIRYTASALGWHWHPMDLAGARRRAERVGYYRALLHAKHGRPAEHRPRWREVIKAVGAPVLRAMPLTALKWRGFSWSLAAPDAAGYARFLAEGQTLHSRP